MKRNSIAVLAFIVVFAFTGCSKTNAQSVGGASSTGGASASKSSVKESPASDFYSETSAVGKGIKIKNYVGHETTVNIPAKINTFPVVEIGEGAFSGQSKITSITIPNTVTKIGDSAFIGTGITSITIPDSVTEIDHFAFSETKLTNINLPDSVTRIGSCSFMDCKDLTEVRLSDNITVIESHAFQGCSNLKKVNFPKNLKEISSDVFAGCSELTELTIPESITRVKFYTGRGDIAFSGCSKLPIKTRQTIQGWGYTGGF